MISFIEQLEDFGLPFSQKEEGLEKHSGALSEENELLKPEVVDTSVHLQPEELEALKKQAFEEGCQKGREEAHEALLSQMTESLNDSFSFLEKEEQQRREVLMQFVQEIFKIVCDIISGQISEKDFIQRKFGQDILSFAQEGLRESEGDIVVSCAESEEEVLKNTLGQHAGIIIKSDPDCNQGCVRILSSRNELKLDRVEWQNKVREQIKSAIDHMTDSNRQQERQEKA